MGLKQTVKHNMKITVSPRDRTGAVMKTQGQTAPWNIEQGELDAWAAPYRGWHYAAEPVIASDMKIPGHEKFHNFDVPTVYQIPGEAGKWFMSFIGFNGQGYNSFVAESVDMVHWTAPRLAMGFG